MILCGAGGKTKLIQKWQKNCIDPNLFVESYHFNEAGAVAKIIHEFFLVLNSIAEPYHRNEINPKIGKKIVETPTLLRSRIILVEPEP
jgi:hypothetical protein